jgi:CII-binding regulator of phage lambda lysogenization HflD
MNNTKKTTLAIVAVLMAAALVVGTAGRSVSTKSAFAASNNSGNTVTGLAC